MKTKELENRFTTVETNQEHMEKAIEKLIDKVDKMETRIYLAMGGFMILTFLVSNNLIKIGGA